MQVARPRRWRALAACLLFCGSAAWAEEMPIRLYTMSDGLVRNRIIKIKRDSRGYLWFATAEGLSIFDGYQFTNFTTDDGLPNRLVNDVLETQSGEYWIATNVGLCRYNPKATTTAQRFVLHPLGSSKESNQVNALLERRDHSIWAGTEAGLWRLNPAAVESKAETVPLPWPAGEAQHAEVLLEDRRGILWVGGEDALYAIWPLGKTTRFSSAKGLPLNHIHSLTEDGQGRVWVATPFGLGAIVANPRPDRQIIKRVYSSKDGLPVDNVTQVFQSYDGKLWVGSLGLFEFTPDAPDPHDMCRSVSSSLEGGFIFSIAEDLDHNLWAVSDANGAVKITRHGFARFTGADGLQSFRVHALSMDGRGKVYVMAGTKTLTVHQFDGKRFIAADPLLPPGIHFTWGESQFTLQDHEGEWWLPTDHGVLRVAAVSRLANLARQLPKAAYTTRQGLPGNIVLRLFEDSRGDIWIGCFEGLARWDRKTEKVRAYGFDEVLGHAADRPPRMVTTNFFAEDSQGRIWIGFYPFGLARFRDGHFDFFSGPDDLPAGQISWLYVDHFGRLWVASSQGGVSRIDDTAAAHPTFHTYTTAQGLSSNQVFSVVEDQSGRIYISGGRGVDRLDVATGTIRRFPLGDGLPSYEAHNSLRDRTGTLWFGSGNGLSRYVPESDSPSRPLSPLIRRLLIDGKAYPVSDLGESNVSGPSLGWSRNNLHIEFASLHFTFGEVLRYQYRLEGADKDWSPAADQRTVNYANLAPRDYRFVVRAVNGDGRYSAADATISFTILPPFWRSWWFVALSVCATLSFLYAGYRYRLKQVVAIERIRTRLASDLHDDIGSGLVEIAIASEIAKAGHHTASTELLQRVGDRARQLRDSISDIVWSVDPRNDHLEDVIGRIRQNAFSLLECNGRRVEFHAPEDKATRGLSLTADRRRHLLLVCKEALANVAKHADASLVSIDLKLNSHMLTLDVCDNGRGFHPEVSHAGLGLRSMKRRASEVGGELVVESSPGGGTRLIFRLPLE